mmetsp:Transcript_13935/g.52264  ORF Transcript_13935/g.52264 Transcript_13935/m.52264 type:complete len:207 (+) Transcript_13935:16-636(+)
MVFHNNLPPSRLRRARVHPKRDARFPHVLRHGRYEGHFLARFGVRHREPLRVKRLAPEPQVTSPLFFHFGTIIRPAENDIRVAPVFRRVSASPHNVRPVQRVGKNGHSRVRQVDTDLVRPAGQRAGAHQRGDETFHIFIFGSRLFQLEMFSRQNRANRLRLFRRGGVHVGMASYFEFRVNWGNRVYPPGFRNRYVRPDVRIHGEGF